jgi:hypothetical protein
MVWRCIVSISLEKKAVCAKGIFIPKRKIMLKPPTKIKALGTAILMFSWLKLDTPLMAGDDFRMRVMSFSGRKLTQ